MKLAHKCFDVIAWLPDNAMKWIGGMGTNFGEGAVEQHMDGRFTQALGGTAQRLQKGLAGGGGGSQSKIKGGNGEGDESGNNEKGGYSQKSRMLAHALENGNVDAPKGAASDAPQKQSKLAKSLESMEDMLESGNSNDD